MKKKGITLLVLIIAILVMLILISSAAVIGFNSINTANFDEYMSKLNRVSDDVNQYYLSNKKLPVTDEQVDALSLGDQFESEVITNNDSNNKLYVIDMSKIEDPSIKIGNGTVQNKDVFLVAENSQNIYYLNGFNYKSKTYFSLAK